ncbi:hypothetical protein [uncultured Sphingomonas sp.]
MTIYVGRCSLCCIPEPPTDADQVSGITGMTSDSDNVGIDNEGLTIAASL